MDSSQARAPELTDLSQRGDALPALTAIIEA